MNAGHRWQRGMIGLHLGFSASVISRIGLGLVVIALAGWMVVAIERPRDRPSVSPRENLQSGARDRVHLTMESTYAVSQWKVTILGVPVVALMQDSWTWQGHPAVGPDDEVLIQAEAADDAGSPHRSLRIRFGTAPARLAWGEGNITTTVSRP